MKKILMILLFVSGNAFAEFNGKWTSTQVTVISSVGTFKDCTSEFEIFETSNHLSFTPVIDVLCEGTKVHLKTLSFDMGDDGILYSNFGRGQISPDMIQIFSPVFYPDGRKVESVSEMKLSSDQSLETYYLIQMVSGFNIEVRGRFLRASP